MSDVVRLDDVRRKVVRLDDVRRKRERQEKAARFTGPEASRLVAAGYKYKALGFVEHVSRATTDEGDESIAIIGPDGHLLRCIAKMRDGSYCVYDRGLKTVLKTRSIDEVLKLLGVT